MSTVPLDLLDECVRTTHEYVIQERRRARAEKCHVRWFIHIQGGCVQLNKKLPEALPPSRISRGVVGLFSLESRMNLLRFLNRVDWDKCQPVQFVTLTYPDDVYRGSYVERSRDRFLFLRYVERCLGIHVPCVWRVEWVKRKSGRFVGNLFPHWHLLLAGTKILYEKWVRNRWAHVLGIYPSWVSVKVKQVEGILGACKYVAKYVSKLPHLDITAYHNSHLKFGRHWGVTRRGMIPMCPVKVSREISQEEAECLLQHKGKLLHPPEPIDQHGFTLFGKDQVELIEKFVSGS